MIPEYQQSIEDIYKSASPEQKIQWQAIRLITGEKAAVRQLSWSSLYGGPNPGLTTFIANRLFFALQIDFGAQQVSHVSNGLIYFADATNNWNFFAQNSSTVFNTATGQANYTANYMSLKNLIFWRYFVGAHYSWVNFIGYVIVY